MYFDEIYVEMGAERPVNDYHNWGHDLSNVSFSQNIFQRMGQTTRYSQPQFWQWFQFLFHDKMLLANIMKLPPTALAWKYTEILNT